MCIISIKLKIKLNINLKVEGVAVISPAIGKYYQKSSSFDPEALDILSPDLEKLNEEISLSVQKDEPIHDEKLLELGSILGRAVRMKKNHSILATLFLNPFPKEHTESTNDLKQRALLYIKEGQELFQHIYIHAKRVVGGKIVTTHRGAAYDRDGGKILADIVPGKCVQLIANDEKHKFSLKLNKEPKEYSDLPFPDECSTCKNGNIKFFIPHPITIGHFLKVSINAVDMSNRFQIEIGKLMDKACNGGLPNFLREKKNKLGALNTICNDYKDIRKNYQGSLSEYTLIKVVKSFYKAVAYSFENIPPGMLLEFRSGVGEVLAPKCTYFGKKINGALPEVVYVTKQLGSGTFGEVVLVESIDNKWKKAALKIAKREFPGYSSTATPELLKAFQLRAVREISHEFRILAYIHNEYIVAGIQLPLHEEVQIVEFSALNQPKKGHFGPAYGGNLIDFLERFGGFSKVPPQQIMSCLTDLFTGNTFLSKNKGLVHCDIKPENILYKWIEDPSTKELELKLYISDYGSIKYLSDYVELEASTTFTPAYVAKQDWLDLQNANNTAERIRILLAINSFQIALIAYILLSDGQSPFDIVDDAFIDTQSIDIQHLLDQKVEREIIDFLVEILGKPALHRLLPEEVSQKWSVLAT